MSIKETVLKTLDLMIEAAQSVDNALHASLDYLVTLRTNVENFGGESQGSDPLVGQLQQLAFGSQE